MRAVVFVVDGEVVETPPEGRFRVNIRSLNGVTEVWMSLKAGRSRQIPDSVRNRIHRDRGEGMPLREIARCLQEEGVPTPKGNPWSVSTVQYVLKDRK